GAGGGGGVLMASRRVTRPQLGESVHEGTISRWLVKPGDRVVEFEPMLEVDTDKVNAEVPAPVTGILREILAREGETVAAGAEIAVVELQGDAEAPATVELRPEDARPVQPAAVAPPTPSTAAPVVSKAGGEQRYRPGVLRRGEEGGVALGQVGGPGLGGRVTKRAVRQFVEAHRGGAAAAAPASPARPPTPAPTARPSPPAAPVPPPPVRP